jgi:salicylate hydroxylase
LALYKHGFDVTVLEQAAMLGEIGAGVQLSPNATRILYNVGVGQRIAPLACEPLGKRVRLWSTGQTWPLFDLGAHSREQYGFPYFTLHRADLHQALVDGVRAIDANAIHLGEKVVEIQQHDNVAIARTARGVEYTADLVIGADGVHSVVRNAFFGPDQPQYSGIMAWRGVVDAARLPKHLRTPFGVNWVGPGAHVIHYPLRAGRLVNFVGVVERDGWMVESWSERGRLDDCLRDFDGWHNDVQMLIRAIETPYKWALMVREPMSRWVDGRVALLGDACHPTLPFLAQGACMALEDGYVLARCIAHHGSNLDVALARYQSLRTERTERVVRGSAANAKRFHNPELAHAAGAAAYVEREWTEAKIHERYDWLFEYDAESVVVE